MGRTYSNTTICEKLTRAQLDSFCDECGFTRSGYSIESFERFKKYDKFLLILICYADSIHMGRLQFIVDDNSCEPFKTHNGYNLSREWRSFIKDMRYEQGNFLGL